ncbi:hypothetical protein I3842_02G093800 [Carya illinoinensis]|uniref:Uncharacterized protein n=1 Tax=Carya illinoinensis TaxID=32201 RepID=A0A922FQQ8_CARIL|nr:hypothetical protein I3842_02G093800 [Carya illinoinensis]KAG6726705.1 hypothetical protein I3842_02G093800 [Carya illinoinensis]
MAGPSLGQHLCRLQLSIDLFRFFRGLLLGYADGVNSEVLIGPHRYGGVILIRMTILQFVILSTKGNRGSSEILQPFDVGLIVYACCQYLHHSEPHLLIYSI